MRITILFLLIGVCLVSAKYLSYDESETSILMRSKRSNSDESVRSVESDNSSDNDEEDEDDSGEKKYKNKRKNAEEKQWQKILEREEKTKRKEEKAQRKLEEKLAKKQRKEEEKREKEERKRLEKIEKEKQKEEKNKRKILEKIEKDERKKQEKQRKQLEKIQKEALEGRSKEDDFLDTEEEISIELSVIRRNHIYVKYGLNLTSTKLEKQVAINKYLQEELGLTSNSTQSDRRHAIMKLIQAKLQNDTTLRDTLKNQLLSHINAVSLYKFQTKLEKDIDKLNYKSNVLNNVTLPWATVMQQNIEKKRSFLQTINQFLSNIFPSWTTGEQNQTQTGNTSVNSNNDLVPENAAVESVAESSNKSVNRAEINNGNIESNIAISSHTNKHTNLVVKNDVVLSNNDVTSFDNSDTVINNNTNVESGNVPILIINSVPSGVTNVVVNSNANVESTDASFINIDSDLSEGGDANTVVSAGNDNLLTGNIESIVNDKISTSTDIVTNVVDISISFKKESKNGTNGDAASANNMVSSVVEHVASNSDTVVDTVSQTPQSTAEIVITVNEALSTVNTASNIAVTEIPTNVSLKQLEASSQPVNIDTLVKSSNLLESGVTIPAEAGAIVVDIIEQ